MIYCEVPAQIHAYVPIMLLFFSRLADSHEILGLASRLGFLHPTLPDAGQGAWEACCEKGRRQLTARVVSKWLYLTCSINHFHCGTSTPLAAGSGQIYFLKSCTR